MAPEPRKTGTTPAPDAFGMKRSRAFAERGLHQLQKREHDALAGQPLGEL